MDHPKIDSVMRAMAAREPGKAGDLRPPGRIWAMPERRVTMAKKVAKRPKAKKVKKAVKRPSPKRAAAKKKRKNGGGGGHY